MGEASTAAAAERSKPVAPETEDRSQASDIRFKRPYPGPGPRGGTTGGDRGRPHLLPGPRAETNQGTESTYISDDRKPRHGPTGPRTCSAKESG